LTNGIGWFIPCAMNANETSPKTNFRLKRIKIVSRIFRVLLGLYFCLVALAALVCFLGWMQFMPRSLAITIMISPHQQFDWPFLIPDQVLALGAVKFVLFSFCILILNKLFRLYERGIFFSAKNVFYIRFLGYYLMIDWLVTLLLEFQSHETQIYFTELIVGLIVIFIAWIMDEGRKIQEEQELTV
jgi:uncharacterized membrane protein HdeD (DUF308 family)